MPIPVYLWVSSQVTTLDDSMGGSFLYTCILLTVHLGGVPVELNPLLINSRYTGGIMGCISELILAGILKLNFDLSTMANAHNVQTGLL